MNTKIIPYVLLVHALVIGNALADQTADANEAQSQLTTIIDLLSKHEIGQVEVLNIPQRILTYARISPETLEEAFNYKLIIRCQGGGIYRQDLIETLKSVEVQPEPGATDFRWGVNLL